MALHIKTKFRTKGPKTLEQRASVVASNIWKVAQEATRHMEIEGYKIGGDRQVTAILTEFLAFHIRSEERRVGNGWRSGWEGSTDVCSSDLGWRRKRRATWKSKAIKSAATGKSPPFLPSSSRSR